MTIHACIGQVDELHENQISEIQKRQWLSQLDHRVFDQVIRRYAPDEETPENFTPYDTETDGDTELLIPSPFDEIYRWYLEMHIALAEREFDAYNNYAALYHTKWGEFTRHYHRTHKTLSADAHYHFG